MPSESGDKKAQKPQSAGVQPPPEHEHLPCPRCDSTHTKFCYYNNYNYSQPRHFCKSCRRYWTHGGTLRDIPVGGGTRRGAKRSRTSSTSHAAAAAAAPTAASAPFSSLPLVSAGAPVLISLPSAAGPLGQSSSAAHFASGACGGGFASLLSGSQSAAAQGPAGFVAFGGFGLEDVGFGLSRGGWPFTAVGDVGPSSGSGGGGVGGVSAGGNTWQFESGDSGFVGGGGDCFAWPDLAISMAGNALK